MNDDDAKDAARYRWLRDGNAYRPEEEGISGGEDLDRFIDLQMSKPCAAMDDNLRHSPRVTHCGLCGWRAE